jgi:hypothetical protein
MSWGKHARIVASNKTSGTSTTNYNSIFGSKYFYVYVNKHNQQRSIY